MGDVVEERLEDQIDWYDARSSQNQRMFKRLKYVEIVAAAAIPVVTGFDVSHLVAAVLGGLVVVVEAVLHLNQYQHTWLTYRATAEGLKHEKFLYLARAGSYAAAPDPRRLLAERVEALASAENTQWISQHEEATPAAKAPAETT